MSTDMKKGSGVASFLASVESKKQQFNDVPQQSNPNIETWNDGTTAGARLVKDVQPNIQSLWNEATTPNGYERMFNVDTRKENGDGNNIAYLLESALQGAKNSGYSLTNAVNELGKYVNPYINADTPQSVVDSFRVDEQNRVNNANQLRDKLFTSQDTSNQQFTEKYEDKQGAIKLAGDVAQGVGGMIPQIGAALVGGPVLNAAMAFGTSFGGTYKDAMQNGSSEEKALLASLLDGGVSAGLNYFLGGISNKFGGGTPLKEKAKSFIEMKLKNDLTKKLALTGYDMAGEGMEEYLEELISNYTKKIYDDNGESFLETLQSSQGEALYAGLLGALTAGAIDGIETSVSNVGNITNGVVNTVNKIDEAIPSGAKSFLNKVESAKNTEIPQNINSNPSNLTATEQLQQGNVVSGAEANNAQTAQNEVLKIDNKYTSDDNASNVFNVDESKEAQGKYFQSKVAKTKQDIVNFFNTFREKKSNQLKEKLFLGKPNNNIVSLVNGLVGDDCSDYIFSLTSDSIRHIEINHGINGKRKDLVKITDENIDLISDTLNHPDIITGGDPDSRGRPTIVFKKEFPFGKTVYAQFQNKSHKEIESISFYIDSRTKKGTLSTGPYTPSVHGTTSETEGLSIPTSSIDQNAENVKADTENNLTQTDINLVDELSKSFGIENTTELETNILPIAQELESTGRLSVETKDNLYRYVSNNTTGDELFNDMNQGKSNIRHYEFDKVLNNYVSSKLSEIATTENNSSYEPDEKYSEYILSKEELQELEKEFEALEKAEENRNIYDYFKDDKMSSFGEMMKDINEGNEGVIESRIDTALATEAIGGKVNVDDTLDRNLDRVAKTADARKELRDKIETPLYEAKSQYAYGLKNIAHRIQKELIEDLGIKPKSAESAAVAKLIDGKQDDKIEPYTLQHVKEEFPNSWENIQKGAEIYRSIMDEYHERSNAKDEMIYPTAVEDVKAEVEKTRKQLDKLKKERDEISKNLFFYEATNKNSELSLETRKNLKSLEAEIVLLSKKYNKQQKEYQSGEAYRNKRLLYRENYYHKFKEQSSGWQQFFDVLNTNADIDPTLVGVSDFTKPNSTWSSLYQKQGLSTDYEHDAIGSLLDYVKEAEYKLAFDPYIATLRGITKNLAVDTKTGKNANSLILYLTDYANDIARKSNPLDRPFKDRILDRKTFRAFQWLSRRVKANAVVGNARTAVAQFFNLPNGLGLVKNPTDIKNGVADWYNMSKDENVQNKINQSAFLTERYMDDFLKELEPSNGKFQDTMDNLTSFMIEYGDKQVAYFTYLSAYNQAERKGISNPSQYADEITRQAVGGRGVGEVPIAQKSELVQLFAPFQLEVANTYHLVGKQLKEKDWAFMLYFLAANWVMNRLAYLFTGATPGADYVDAVVDGASVEGNAIDKTIAIGGRLAGETISNAPFGNVVADIALNSMSDTQREEIFGETDPSRYGVGNLVTDTIVKPLGQFLSGDDVDLKNPILSALLPYGAKQVTRTTDFLEDVGALPEVKFNRNDGLRVEQKDGVYTNDGRLKFEVDDNPFNMVRGALFGTSATTEAKDYYDNERSPLSANQTKAYEKARNLGADREALIEAIYKAKEIKSVQKNGKTIDYSKAALIRDMLDEYDFTTSQKKALYESVGVSEKIANMKEAEFRKFLRDNGLNY